MAAVATEISIPYGMKVHNEITIPIALRVVNEIAITYTSLERIAREIEVLTPLPSYAIVRAEISLLYGGNAVKSEVTISYSSESTVAAEVEIPTHSSSVVRNEVSAPYAILSYIPVATETEVTSSFEDISLIFGATEPILEYEGKIIDMEEVEVFTSEGSFIWEARIKLLNIDDYTIFTQDAPFTITLGADVYSFIVDTKELSRTGPQF